MKVQVRLFAGVKEAAGAERIEVELPAGATIGQLRRYLAERLPEHSNLIGLVMFAVDAQYASDDTRISPDDNVACIPPVSGG